MKLPIASNRFFRASTVRLRAHWRGLLAVVVVLTLAHAMWVELLVQKHISGRLWPEPARIYASPTELYAGQKLRPAELRTELLRLGYSDRRPLAAPGSFTHELDRVWIHTRGFLFPEGFEPATLLRLEFDDGRITSVVADSSNAEIALARLDPLLIGSIYPRTGEDRLLLKRDEFPPILVEMLLAIEDRNFYEHKGIDPKGLLRAFVVNLKAMQIVQGGSTLTQQLVKNRMLDKGRNLLRKFNEFFMAFAVERRLSKDEILHLYLNEIYMGQDGKRPIHGFGLASHFYFAKPLHELELSELALLVAMNKGPSVYDPRRSPERARARRDLVLSSLAEQGVISEEDAGEARARPLGASELPERGTASYPAMLDLVRRQLLEDYPEEVLDSEGLRIFTTLSPTVQASAEKALSEGLRRLESSYGKPEGSLEGAVVVSSVSGAEVLAVVGGRQAAYEGFNRALDARRPVGSLLKPAVYLRALESGRFTWATGVLDSSISVEMPNGDLWEPTNHDETELGVEIPMFQALAQSINLPTVRVALDLGMESIVETIGRLGVRAEIPPYPSVALGAVELTPIDMLQMYNTLAAGGFQSRVNALRDVLDADGNKSKRYPLQLEQTLDRKLVYMMNAALAYSTQEGTSAALSYLLPDGLDVAGKTGTSDLYRDSWFAGFSADRVAVVRVGHDDATPCGLSGATGALPIWAQLMSSIPTRSYKAALPEGVEEIWVDPLDGREVGSRCDGAVLLPFVEGSGPERGRCGRSSLGEKAVRWFKGIFKDN